MTLSFSIKWPDRMGDLAGQPNYFIEKIWGGVPEYLQGRYYDRFVEQHLQKFGDDWDYTLEAVTPKLHTIRLDPSNRWKSGMKIHPVINNRTPNRFQFAPTMECVSVQRINIHYHWGGLAPSVRIDGKLLNEDDLLQLALNDGFPSVGAFFAYFNTDFSGNLIHWTDLKY